MSETTNNTQAAIDSAKALAKAQADAAEFLETNPNVFFVRDSNKFYEYNQEEDKWYSYSPEGFRNGSKLLRPQLSHRCFMDALENQGKVFKTLTFSVRPDADPHALNLIVRDAWIQESDLTTVRTDDTKFFDYIIEALGNGDEAQMKHIRQVIAWKWMHPEDVTLPCLCFYGEGRAGKGILAQEIGTTIFSKNASFTGKMHTLERFNGPLAGKLIFNFDETIKEKSNLEFIKSIIGAKHISIELKGREQTMCENTALYMISSNSYSGAMRLENNSAQDRWSFLKITKTLAQVVAEREGLGEFDSEDESSTSVKSKALALINKAVAEVYTNRAEVAVFLAECVEVAKELNSSPRAFHGANLRELMDTNNDPLDMTCREVFLDFKRFEWISLDALYQLYVERTKNSGGKVKGTGTFFGEVEGWLIANKLDKTIQKQQRARVAYGTAKKQVNLYAHTNVIGTGFRFIDNSNFFLHGGHTYITDDGETDPKGASRAKVQQLSKVLEFSDKDRANKLLS